MPSLKTERKTKMQEKTERTKRQKIIADIILFLCLILVGLSVFLIGELLCEKGEFVTVKVGNSDEARYSLSEDGEYTLNGGTNILTIRDGKAFMSHADCPDKTCVRSGKINMTGERIVCLPNRIYITVVGTGEEVIR